jgi:hypothetical protein
MSRRKPAVQAMPDLLRSRLAREGRLRRLGITTGIPWEEVDAVVGTRADLTRTGIKRPCSRCGQDTFTGRVYPDDVPLVCEQCAVGLAEEEEGDR